MGDVGCGVGINFFNAKVLQMGVKVGIEFKDIWMSGILSDVWGVWGVWGCRVGIKVNAKVSECWGFGGFMLNID